MTSNDDNLDFGFDEIPADALERLPDPDLARHWPQSLVAMLQVIEAEYVEIGLAPRIAQRLAFATLISLIKTLFPVVARNEKAWCVGFIILTSLGTVTHSTR